MASPIEVLTERLAKGEITIEQFDDMSRRIRAVEVSPNPPVLPPDTERAVRATSSDKSVEQRSANSAGRFGVLRKWPIAPVLVLIPLGFYAETQRHWMSEANELIQGVWSCDEAGLAGSHSTTYEAEGSVRSLKTESSDGVTLSMLSSGTYEIDWGWWPGDLVLTEVTLEIQAERFEVSSGSRAEFLMRSRADNRNDTLVFDLVSASRNGNQIDEAELIEVFPGMGGLMEGTGISVTFNSRIEYISNLIMVLEDVEDSTRTSCRR